MQISWASVGPIVLMGRLLARVKSVSVAPKKRRKKKPSTLACSCLEDGYDDDENLIIIGYNEHFSNK